MEHKFLFEPGLWKVRGILSMADHLVAEIEGSYAVAHEPARWSVAVELVPKPGVDETGKPSEHPPAPPIRRTMEVAPFERYADTSTWLMADQAQGRLTGRVAVVFDTFIFDLEGEGVRGVEFMAIQTENQYTVRGCLYRDGLKQSSWALELTRA